MNIPAGDTSARAPELRQVESDFEEYALRQMGFGLLIYSNATRSGEGTAISRRPKNFYT